MDSKYDSMIFRFKCSDPGVESWNNPEVFTDLFVFLDTILDFISNNLDRIEHNLYDYNCVDSKFMGTIQTYTSKYPLYLPYTAYTKALSSALDTFVEHELYEKAAIAKSLLDKIKELKLKQND